jgi:mannosyltransferase OCH1-like enzyme
MYIKIYHTTWKDDIILNDNLFILSRESGNKDSGKYILINNFLKIKWDLWDTEYFYSDDLINYYYINLIDKISIIQLFNTNSKTYILNNINGKIYDYNNLILYGDYTIDNYDINKIIIKNNISSLSEIYIYINFKYYNFKNISKNYKIIYIFNKLILLDKNNNNYFINNFEKNDLYTYKEYKNKIILNQNEVFTTYISYDSNNYIPYIPSQNNNYIINKKSDKTIFFINCDDIIDILNIIDYCKNFNINCILFDNINNTDKNILYDDIIILYYHNIEELIDYIKKYTINEDSLNVLCGKSNILFIDNFKKYNIKYVLYNNSLLNNSLLDNSLLNSLKININKLWYKINENLLLKNNLKNTDQKGIPKIMHFIWIGKNEIPNIYIVYIKTWIINHKDWIFFFWTDKNIPKLINQKYYDEASEYAMKADILRYELLYFFGGVYVDCDFISFKNIDNLISKYDAFSAYESDKYIAIGLMGFKPFNPLLSVVIKNIPYSFLTKRHNSTIPEITGPVFFTNIWEKNNNSNKYHSFEPKFFYSYSYQDKLDNKKYIINDDTYAIHTWGYSWNTKI